MPPITNVDRAPGVSVDIADGQLRVQRPQPGPKVTILATTTSETLPLYEPVLVDTVPLAMRLARHANGWPSEMSLALAEAVRVGATSIELIKIDSASGEFPDVYSANDRFDALEETYKRLKLLDIDQVVPVNAHFDETGLSGISPDGQSRSMGFARQLANFCYQATKEWNTCSASIGARPINRVARAEGWANAPTGLAGEFFDDPTITHVQEWVYHLRGEAGDLVDHTADNTHEGFIAGSEETSPGQISTSYDGWAYGEDSLAATDRNGVAVDGYAYLDFCAIMGRIRTDETQNLANRLGVPAEVDQHVLSSGAVAYAAFLTTLDPEEATTNRAIPGVSPSRRMGGSLAEDLLQVRMVTMLDRGGAYVVMKDVTGGYNGSPYTRTDYTLRSTVRIMHSIVDAVRTAGFRYIGRPITAGNVAALEGDVRSRLQAMKPSGAVQSFKLYTTASPDAQTLGEVNVEVAAVIGHELTKINAFTALQKPEAIG